jgi:metallo-beta-lactamase family protein
MKWTGCFRIAIIRRLFAALNPELRPPVFADSPLGLEITKIYSSLSGYWDNEAKQLYARGDHPIDFEHLYAVKDYKDHLRLMDLKGPAVIIAGSGMCTGGRIVDYLKSGLEGKRNDLFFIGYQAKGSTGRDIIKYSKRLGGYVYLDGKRVSIKAKVHTLTGYSAHADQKGLIDWVESISEKPKKIKLVHGERKAQEALAVALESKGYCINT